MKRYFHRLTKEEFETICDEHITWGECARRYSQPKWCSYPDAVGGLMGCWSLMALKVKSREFCEGCDCYLKELNEKSLTM